MTDYAQTQSAQSATPTYKPKVGDRVRVTIEGEVTEVSPSDGWFDIGANYIPTDRKEWDRAEYTIEKLADPEPKWVNGDVVRHANSVLAFRHGDWFNVRTGFVANSEFVSKQWRNDDLQILWKAPAVKEPNWADVEPEGVAV